MFSKYAAGDWQLAAGEWLQRLKKMISFSKVRISSFCYRSPVSIHPLPHAPSSRLYSPKDLMYSLLR